MRVCAGCANGNEATAYMDPENNLLMRFYELQGGRITIDGVDIAKMRRVYLRSLMGMVLQDTWLFGGTLRDNIGYSKENADDEEIYKAAKAARADHFIRTILQYA